MEYFYAGNITKYTTPAVRQNHSLLKDFYAACEVVKDLPAQNGDEPWANFNTRWSKIKTKDWATSNALQRHASKQLQDSPLFEVLFQSFNQVKPPTTFARAGRGGWRSAGTKRVEVDFTAKEFITTCIELDVEYKATKQFALNPTMKNFGNMATFLCRKKVNVLDFLSTDLTDELLETCRFLKALVHCTSPVRHHVVFGPEFLEPLFKPQDFHHAGSQMLVPPYPPNKWGLSFDYADFLEGLQAAEADMHGLTWPNWDQIESFDILHVQLHQLGIEEVDLEEFMDGREPTEGTPGAIIYKHVLNSTIPVDPFAIDCTLFFANVVSNGDGPAFLQSLPGHGPPPGPVLLTRDEATYFVDALQKADVADLLRDSIRCSHCWSDFDEVEEGVNNLPVQLPCDSRHLLGRDCLIEILTSMGPLCTLCRVDIVAIGPPVAPDSSS
jgi:hypothetical protein